MNCERSRLILSALAALALLAFPALAAAKPGYEVRPKSLELDLGVKASDGYEASVHTVGHKQVTLTVEGHGGSASYQVDGQVSRHGIEADFGEFGHISVHFKGVRKRSGFFSFLDADCKGRRPVREVGVFRGSIEFDGEHDFTRVDANQARGGVRRSYRQVCGRGPKPFSARASARPGHPKSDTARLVELLATEISPSRRASLIAIDLEVKDRLLQELFSGFFPIVGATVMERVGAVRISRAAVEFGNRGAFLVSPPGGQPATATLALATPFSGTAKFTRKPGSPPTLTGSLSVKLPGGGTVALAGPGFIARFCRASIDDKACIQKADAELGLPEEGEEGSASVSAQGSGSHSQAFAEARLSWSR